MERKPDRVTSSCRQRISSTGFRQSTLTLALAGVVSGYAGMAWADQTAERATSAAATTATTATTATAQLEEVVVTAQKRKEPLQKTPIAITALTARDLETMRIDNLMDLTNKMPSVNIVPFTGNRAAPNLSIRGMSNNDSQSTKDSAFGIYIDGVPIGRGVGLASDIADLERVEVLRGPQGTLYGRNTTAGAINFITVKPEREFSFEQTLTAGNHGLVAGKTRINVPLSDQLYTRFSYLRSSKDGWVKNRNTTLPNQTDFNNDDNEAARLAVRLLATDHFKADLSFDHSKMTYGNIFFQRIGGATAVPGRQESTANPKGLSPSQTKIDGQNLTLSWKLDALELKSITAGRKMSNRLSQSYIDLFTQTGDQNQDQFSQEFQAVGDAWNHRLEYAAGLFYYKENADEYTKSDYGGPMVDVWRVKSESKSTALYGQATWKPPVLEDRLRLTVGVRQTHDQRMATKSFIVSGFMPASNGAIVAGDRSFNKFTPTYTVDYAFTDDINGYAKIANGYRAGGFNTRSPYSSFGNGFNPENVRSTEIGLKTNLFERRLRLNAAAFVNRFANLQVDQQRTPAIFTDTLNAGKARIQGAEIELNALVGQGLTANLFYTWLQSEYETYIDNGINIAAIRHLPNSPKGQAGVGLRYDGPRIGYGKLAASLDYKWQSRLYAGPANDTRTNGYGLWDGRIQLGNIALSQGTLRVALWGKNLANKEYRRATTNLGVLSAQYGEPRMLGIDVTYDY
ncbi:MAG: TonB-dependent receptor [Sterolibacterium sp.]|nr:TonB-dependent receptor [Sterolibacterium sp.]